MMIGQLIGGGALSVERGAVSGDGAAFAAVIAQAEAAAYVGDAATRGEMGAEDVAVLDPAVVGAVGAVGAVEAVVVVAVVVAATTDAHAATDPAVGAATTDVDAATDPAERAATTDAHAATDPLIGDRRAERASTAQPDGAEPAPASNVHSARASRAVAREHAGATLGARPLASVLSSTQAFATRAAPSDGGPSAKVERGGLGGASDAQAKRGTTAPQLGADVAPGEVTSTPERADGVVVVFTASTDADRTLRSTAAQPATRGDDVSRNGVGTARRDDRCAAASARDAGADATDGIGAPRIVIAAARDGVPTAMTTNAHRAEARDGGLRTATTLASAEAVVARDGGLRTTTTLASAEAPEGAPRGAAALTTDARATVAPTSALGTITDARATAASTSALDTTTDGARPDATAPAETVELAAQAAIQPMSGGAAHAQAATDGVRRDVHARAQAPSVTMRHDRDASVDATPRELDAARGARPSPARPEVVAAARRTTAPTWSRSAMAPRDAARTAGSTTLGAPTVVPTDTTIRPATAMPVVTADRDPTLARVAPEPTAALARDADGVSRDVSPAASRGRRRVLAEDTLAPAEREREVARILAGTIAQPAPLPAPRPAPTAPQSVARSATIDGLSDRLAALRAFARLAAMASNAALAADANADAPAQGHDGLTPSDVQSGPATDPPATRDAIAPATPAMGQHLDAGSPSGSTYARAARDAAPAQRDDAAAPQRVVPTGDTAAHTPERAASARDARIAAPDAPTTTPIAPRDAHATTRTATDDARTSTPAPERTPAARAAPIQAATDAIAPAGLAPLATSSPHDRGPAPVAAPAIATPVAPPDVIATPDGHIGPRRAAITVGEGEDKVRMIVSTHGTRVHVELATASDALASALNHERDQLDRALAHQGLELGSLAAHADGRGTGEAPQQRDGADDHEPPTARDADPSPAPTTRRGARAVI